MPAPRIRLDDLPPHIRAALAGEATAPRKAPRAARGPSKLEESFALALRVQALPVAEREHRFHPSRQWRFDFAWPGLRLAVEIEGGVWTGGRHTRGSGFVEDCEKYNAAVLLGWRVLRFAESHVKNGTAIRVVKEALANARAWG